MADLRCTNANGVLGILPEKWFTLAVFLFMKASTLATLLVLPFIQSVTFTEKVVYRIGLYGSRPSLLVFQESFFSAGPDSGQEKKVSPQKRKTDSQDNDEDDDSLTNKMSKTESVTLPEKTSKGISISVGKKTGISMNIGVNKKLSATPIKMALSAQAIKETPVVKSKSGQVATVFNEDSESDEEEMPMEAKMRMRNVGRETPTAAGPNSFGKGNLGFCDRTKMIERELKKQMDKITEKEQSKH